MQVVISNLEVQGRASIQDLRCFMDPYDALDYVKGNEVHAAFLDITMPGMDGITLGKKIKEVNPKIEIIYVTGYSDYALESYKIGGRAYLMKPYTDEELNGALELLEKLIIGNVKQIEQIPQQKVYMKTFGGFDMLVNGNPVAFKNAKAKELLALLIDQKGGSLTSHQIFNYLWEGRNYDAVTSTYVRRALRALHEQLGELGIEEIFIDNRNAKSVDVSKIQCDYYEIMEGDTTHLFEYNGYYMSQYSWAEDTIGIIEGKVMMLKNK